MHKAFVLLTTAPGFEGEVLDELNAIPEVKETHGVVGMQDGYGVHVDLIIRVEANSQDNLKQVIQQRVRGLDKVRAVIMVIEVG